ncbi:Acyl-coenzyme A thioesterase 9, mitochondrial [Thoreauomyces humboldtii]|nr:Acyl-coenzyme A thioesterase 9, mitochondrial [Thoreauomyces humboldtii]
MYEVSSLTACRMWINRYLSAKKQQAIATIPSATSPSSSAPPAPRLVLTKPMKSSYIEEYLLFKSDPDVREEYIGSHGAIRMGKILEDLDALAGSISYFHCDDGIAETIPLKIVTASLDRIDLLKPIPTDQDVRMSGHVTWVGSSSMEVSVWLETVIGGAPKSSSEGEAQAGAAYGLGQTAAERRVPGEPILAAKFTMVARDPVSGGSAKVNQLSLDTEEERRLFRSGASHRAQKLADKKFDLSSTPPSFEEMKLVHELYLEYIQYLDPTYGKAMPEDVTWMKDSFQQTLVKCEPQDRNIHGNVFGGYLIRLAYELASATGLIFAKSRVHFVALDDISFQKPVHVGSLLSLTSQVVYSTGPKSRSFQVKVRADVLDPERDLQSTTNVFHFTFESESPVSRIMPRSYDEKHLSQMTFRIASGL